MTRRIIFIILGALLFLLLLGVVWFWFFRGGGAPAATPPGSFGSSGDKTATAPPTPNTNNIPSVVPGGSTNVSTGVIPGGSGAGSGGGGAGSVPGVAEVPGVDWLGGGGPTTSFVPSAINQLNNGSVSGSPYITGTGGGESGGGGLGLGGAILGAGIVGAVSCTAFLATGAAGVLTSSSIVAVQVNAPTSNNKSFLDCMMRTVAKVALQQMTASIVNWINSGFNGQPSFVRNYQQFFTNVADQAAGEFIKGSSLSFLCSPFQAQIKIAIAQSYARRNAQSCTLTGVIKNVTGFMNGNFSQGGWAGLLQFTTIPTNNPYGAFAYAQVGLASAQASAVGQKQQDYILGRGFLSFEKDTNCRLIAGSDKISCQKVTATPGSVISDSISKTLGVSQDTLVQAGVSGSFDAIISALISQLMTKTLQSGLSSLSGSQGYGADYLTPEEQQAQKDAQALLLDMQAKVQLAQQYGSTEQGSISDIQNTQSQLQALINCWETASSSPALSSAKRLQAQQNAESARSLQQGYEGAINTYNINITRANSAIARLQDLQTQVLSVSSAADVAAATAAYQSALAGGSLITDADVTQAQQDRTSLQSALSSTNAQTASDIQRCNAF